VTPGWGTLIIFAMRRRKGGRAFPPFSDREKGAAPQANWGEEKGGGGRALFIVSRKWLEREENKLEALCRFNKKDNLITPL